MKYFLLSYIVTACGAVCAFWWGGFEALAIATLLTLMEVSLSFDNAVVNATVLKHMSEVWQRRFLTWGILIAVFGMRLVFPIVIVAFATGLGFADVTHMAFYEREAYRNHVMDAHIDIASFGGMFLLMVFLQFILNTTRDIHWIAIIERKLARLGKLEAVEIVIALSLLMILQQWLPEEARAGSLISGTIGVVSYVFIKSVTALFSDHDVGHSAVKTASYSGFAGFMYLQLLDASFSLDGVIGAFAMSNDVVIIMIGLGVGAMFVRSLTVYLVRKGTLDEFVFLEHGAHYGIGALALIMLFSMFYHVPEVITGLIGVTLIGLSLISSVRYRRR